MNRILVIFSFIFIGCGNNIETTDTLNKPDKDYIKSLNLLDNDEEIIMFYSEFKNRTAGNFFTNKRIAKYWIDQQDKSKNEVDFAYYHEIKSIDTVYNPGVTYCPYMLVTKNTGSRFKVCVDGNKHEIRSFFEDALLESGKSIKKAFENENYKAVFD